MSLIDTVISALADGTRWSTDHRYPFIGIASAATGTAIWAVWKSANPYRRQVTAPTGPVTRDANLPASLGGPSLAGPTIITASAITGSNLGPDGRTAYQHVGPDAVRIAVDQFYRRITADPDLTPYFEGVDMERLRRHQALFIGQLWGGPVHFELERLASAHTHLNIGRHHYWRAVGHLMNVITELEVPDWVCLFTMGALYDVQAMIIGRGAADPTAPTPDAAPAPACPADWHSTDVGDNPQQCPECGDTDHRAPEPHPLGCECGCDADGFTDGAHAGSPREALDECPPWCGVDGPKCASGQHMGTDPTTQKAHYGATPVFTCYHGSWCKGDGPECEPPMSRAERERTEALHRNPDYVPVPDKEMGHEDPPVPAICDPMGWGPDDDHIRVTTNPKPLVMSMPLLDVPAAEFRIRDEEREGSWTEPDPPAASPSLGEIPVERAGGHEVAGPEGPIPATDMGPGTNSC